MNNINFLREYAKDKVKFDKELNSLNNTYVDKDILNLISVPMVDLPERNGQVRAGDVFSMMLKHRNIMLIGAVEEGLGSIVIASLFYLDCIDTKGEELIKVYINSPGGNIVDGLAIFDTMMHIESPLVTIGFGMCASMGSFLLSAGKFKNGAYALPSTEIMIHQPLGGASGQATDIEISSNRIVDIKTHLTSIYTLAVTCKQGYINANGEIEPIENGLNDPKNLEVLFSSNTKPIYCESDELLEETYIKLLDTMERDSFFTAKESESIGLINGIIYSENAKNLDNGLVRMKTIADKVSKLKSFKKSPLLP